ncbi:spindolin-related protein [Vibrio sp. JCM 19053]|nr:spindolin-related protein [Vibrio sp. JCM 19053]
MKSHVTLPLLSLSAVAALSSFNVNAHGWVEFQVLVKIRVI